MAVKTVHVYRSDGTWTAKKEGYSAKTFLTQHEAVAAAQKSIKKNGSGQLVVHGRDGQVRKRETYRMTRIQNHPKKSPLAREIGRAVGQVVLKRVQEDGNSPREHSTKKQPHLHQLSI